MTGNILIVQYQKIQIGDSETMTDEYGSSGSFWSIVRSKYIGHNTYTGRRINLLSKPALIHVPAHTYDFNYSCSISHFSWLPQAVATKLLRKLVMLIR